MAELTLYAESSWMSPWVFHAVVALEEKQLPYKLEVVSLPMSDAARAELQALAIHGKVPLLVHGSHGITESLAISEYLAETFPMPAHPRLFPADLAQRARARQVMSWLRTSLGALRAERPTSNVFGRPTVRALSPAATADAGELLRVAQRLIVAGRSTMFDEWSIADADLALALMRLIGSRDPVPDALVRYAHAQWDRRSIRRYIAHVPTTP